MYVPVSHPFWQRGVYQHGLSLLKLEDALVVMLACYSATACPVVMLEAVYIALRSLTLTIAEREMRVAFRKSG